MIPDRVFDLHDRRILENGAAGPRLGKAQDALDLVGNALQRRAQWVGTREDFEHRLKRS